MDSERIASPVQEEEGADMLSAEEQIDSEQEAQEAQQHTDEVYQVMLEESGLLDAAIPADTEAADPEQLEITDTLTSEGNPSTGGNDDISDATDLALFEMEEKYSNEPEEKSEETVRKARVEESRYYALIAEHDNDLNRDYRRTVVRDDNILAAWGSIKSAFTSHRILRLDRNGVNGTRVKVAGAEQIRLKNGDTEVIAKCSIDFLDDNGEQLKDLNGNAIIFYAYMKLEELFVNPPSRFRRNEEMSDSAYRQRCKNVVGYMIGAVIPVTVTRAEYIRAENRSRFLIFVSRREAILRHSVAFYEMHGNPAQALTNVGDIVRAKVISVSAYNVTINVRGMDLTLNAVDLTCRPVDNCLTFYHVNDEVRVEITNIEWAEDLQHTVMLCADYDDLRYRLENVGKRTPEYAAINERLQYNRIVSLPKLTVNGSRLEARELYRKYSSEIRIGTLTSAVVENVYYKDNFKIPTVRLYLDQYHLVGYARSVNYSRIVGAISKGVHVTFQIEGVNQRNMPFLYGRIMNIIPTKD